MRKSLLAVAKALSAAAVIAGLMFGTSTTWAQQKSASIKDQIAGSWSLNSVIVDQGGKKVEPYGPNPKGMLILNGDGHFTLINMRPDLPKVASNNRDKQTAQESKAIAEGILAYFGTYTVNDKDGTISVKIEGSSFPNWNGVEQKRTVTVSANELKWVNPTSPTGGGSATVTWKRAK